MKCEKLLCVLFGVYSVLCVSCSELAGINGSFVTSNEGGKVPSTLQFQNYRFRTGAAFKSTQLGAIGLKRTSGHNVFSVKAIPKISELALVRSASFARNSRSEFQFVGDLSLTDIKNLNAEAGGSYRKDLSESGIFTIYYVANVKDLVDQLNADDNADLRNYLSRSKDFRIITAIVKVRNHSLLLKSGSNVNVNLKALAALEQEGTATASTEEKDGSAKTVEIKDDNKTRDAIPRGLQIADGGTYAYEFSRIVWDKTNPDKKIIDLLVDRPGRWYSWRDGNDHEYLRGTHNPRDIPRAEIGE